jgi:hypothetical protein
MGRGQVSARRKQAVWGGDAVEAIVSGRKPGHQGGRPVSARRGHIHRCECTRPDLSQV